MYRAKLKMKQHRVTVLVQVTVLTFSRVQFALLMVSPDRGKPLKLQHKLQISAIEISWQPEPQVPFLRAYGMQFRGFIVSYSLVIKFHKTGNNVLNSTVIEIFHGKGNCLGTNAGPYGKSRTGFVNWYLLISCHNQFYCFSFNPFLLSTLKWIGKKMYIINLISWATNYSLILAGNFSVNL